MTIDLFDCGPYACRMTRRACVARQEMVKEYGRAKGWSRGTQSWRGKGVEDMEHCTADCVQGAVSREIEQT